MPTIRNYLLALLREAGPPSGSSAATCIVPARLEGFEEGDNGKKAPRNSDEATDAAASEDALHPAAETPIISTNCLLLEDTQRQQ